MTQWAIRDNGAEPGVGTASIRRAFC